MLPVQEAPTIKALRPAVAATIKSSTSILSLEDAVIGLLRNSLSAGSTKIYIKVNFDMSGCQVRDNGRGIAPDIFQRVATLKEQSISRPAVDLENRTGRFLDYLATLSELRITSRTEIGIHPCTVTFAYGESVLRSKEMASKSGKNYMEPGTWVNVQNLFANIPVRLKYTQTQRSQASIQRACICLQLRIAAELLASGAEIHLSLSGDGWSDTVSLVPRSTGHREYELLVLTRLCQVLPFTWPAWSCVSFENADVKIEGMISSAPAPSQQTQFISWDHRPLIQGPDEADLYRIINDLFCASSFATLEVQGESKDPEKHAEVPRKGVDRWAMFVLHVKLCNTLKETSPCAQVVAVTIALRELVLAWLESHCHKSRKSIRVPSRALESTNHESSQCGADQVTILSEFSRSDSRPVSTGSLSRSRCSTKMSLYRSCNRTGNNSQISSGVGSISIDHERVTDMNKLVHSEELLTWKDPATGDLVNIDERSGLCSLRHEQDNQQRPKTAPASFSLRHLRLQPRKSSQVPGKSTSWIANLLKDWQNPVFKAGEEPLSLLFQNTTAEGECTISSVQGGRHSSQFSAIGLEAASVIAQVDKKFILIEMPVNGEGRVLALIDQHAADERCRVEDLMRELCTSPTNEEPHTSSLGWRSGIKATTKLAECIEFDLLAAEGDILTRHAAYFARWGILFGVFKLPVADGIRCRVLVSELPSLVVERCLADTSLLRDMLRTEAWRQESYGTWKSENDTRMARPTTSGRPGRHTWLLDMHTCPPGLVSMLNSRACRSAIMFNDVLSIEQSTDLVKRLSQCAFPFQCAHGRPSIIPLAHVDAITTNSISSDVIFAAKDEASKASTATDTNFVTQYRCWRATSL